MLILACSRQATYLHVCSLNTAEHASRVTLLLFDFRIHDAECTIEKRVTLPVGALSNLCTSLKAVAD